MNGKSCRNISAPSHKPGGPCRGQCSAVSHPRRSENWNRAYLQGALVAVFQHHPAGVPLAGAGGSAACRIPGLAAGRRSHTVRHGAHNAGVAQPGSHPASQRQVIAALDVQLARVYDLDMQTVIRISPILRSGGTTVMLTGLRMLMCHEANAFSTMEEIAASCADTAGHAEQVAGSSLTSGGGSIP